MMNVKILAQGRLPFFLQLLKSNRIMVARLNMVLAVWFDIRLCTCKL